MPGTTPLGIHYPLGSEVPKVAPDMQTLATDVDTLLRWPRASVYFGSASASRTPSVWQVIGTLTANHLLGMSISNSTRLNVLTAGIYRVQASLLFAAAASPFGNRRGVMIRKNSADDPATGTQIAQSVWAQFQAGAPSNAYAAGDFACNAGDYLQMFSFHDAGAAINLTGASPSASFLTASYLGPLT